MDDLTLTKACAEAMGIEVVARNIIVLGECWMVKDGHEVYDPLHDDAQAMALVKMLKPAGISYNIFAGKWSVHTLRDNETGAQWQGWDADLNRAIVECVAKMKG